jgi:glycosyltransferase involved in cell wall biosynthesis
MSFDLGDWLFFWPFPRGRARRWVRAGDASRESRDWAKAASQYRRALSIEPGRRSIWVQLGHAEKEAGATGMALEAYRRASALRGEDGDAPLHWGLLARASGDMVTARSAFDQALHEDILHQDAKRERLALAHFSRAVGEAAAQQGRNLCRVEQERQAMVGGASPFTIFDASDLIGYFRHSRLPTGIQRVQLEIIGSALAIDPLSQVCAFVEDLGRWASIPTALFQSISALCVASGDILDPAWLNAIEILTGILASGPPPQFGVGARLVNLGTSCQWHNYFLHIRELQREHGVHYVPFVHDLIPIMAPQFCLTGLKQDFLGWAAGVFDHASAFLTNSRSTAADLQKVAAQFGHVIADERIFIIPLDADFRRPGLATPDVGELDRWQLKAGGYALFVSTIEARKNHLLAFRGWAELIARHGIDAVPDLICVGHKGWLNDDVYQLLNGNALLASRIKILSGLSDETIGLLYRHCCFTLYPSHYEGWGLPVTESLCYGKVPILSRCTALPEAGGDLAIYIEPNDVEGLISSVARLWFDEPWREGLEERIRTCFRPRSWRDIARQIGIALQDALQSAPSSHTHGPLMPMVRFGILNWLTRNRLTQPVRGADDGERWRYGTGWWQLEDHGSWTTPDGGTLLVDTPAQEGGQHWCCLRLHGPLHQATDVCVMVNGRDYAFALTDGEPCWIAIPIDEGRLCIKIKGQKIIDLAQFAGGQDRRRIGVGVSRMMLIEGRAPTDTSCLARSVAGCETGTYRFLRDVYDLLSGQDVDIDNLQSTFLALESGALTREGLIASLERDLPAPASKILIPEADVGTAMKRPCAEA